ncbi:MAG TPA: hypothetical protein GXX72_07930 [Clostridiaceae bacterium]|nr:hypothetical protein [Clostridiaceae bacterium]
MDKISFLASMPDIQSWLTIHGKDGIGRIKLDTPSSELPQVLKMTMMAGKLLRVTVEEVEE